MNRAIGPCGIAARLVVTALAAGLAALALMSCSDAADVSACETASQCSVTIADVEVLGIGVETELFEEQRDTWKAIWENTQLNQAEVVLEGNTVTTGGKKETGPILRVTCDRAAAEKIDWDNVDVDGVKTLCSWVPLVAF